MYVANAPRKVKAQSRNICCKPLILLTAKSRKVILPQSAAKLRKVQCLCGFVTPQSGTRKVRPYGGEPACRRPRLRLSPLGVLGARARAERYAKTNAPRSAHYYLSGSNAEACSDG